MELTRLAKASAYLFRINVKYARRPRRYRQLLREIRICRPSAIVEIGVYDGVRGVEMIEAAALHRPVEEITYFGFDLFDRMTQAVMSDELSKWPSTEQRVLEKLQRTGAQIRLSKGFTQDTLPEFVESRGGNAVDFVFIDGGHSIETICSDWENVRRITGRHTTVLFDDYYVDRPDLIEKFGCNGVVRHLDREEFDWVILPDVDRFRYESGQLGVSIVRVRRRP